MENTMQDQGLISDQMQGGELSPEKIRQQIQMPPELQEAYDRVVIAGMKVMFSEATNQKVMNALKGEGPIGTRLGVAIAGLIATLFQKSNKTIPPQVLIPAGVDLLAQAADFIKKSGAEQISDKDVGEAMDTMVQIVLDMFGIDPKKVLAKTGFDRSNIEQQAQQMEA